MKKIIQRLLEIQVKRYFKKHVDTKLVVVTGSVGKTGTKAAIATVLKQRYKVRAHEGNHNTDVSVPLALLDIPYPEKVHSVWAWVKVLLLMQARIRQRDDVDVIVQELGTDKPGDIKSFSTYLKPDIAVVTAVSPEHMEFFKTIEAVAEEELSVASFSKLTIINRDDINEDYAKYANTHQIDTYGTSGVAEFRYVIEDSVPGTSFNGKFVSPTYGEIQVRLQLVGEHNVRAAVAAATVGAKLELSSDEVKLGLQEIKPVAGRMQLLRGVNNSLIIDDTYNSSPLAAQAALQTLYGFQTPQRIAILGSMNELGDTSARAHAELGEMCDPSLLAWVVTIGEEARLHLAPAAIKKGCQVKCFHSPYNAGAFVHKVLEHDGVVLAKGSQNGVFAEESLKAILHATQEENSLVRQSPAWIAKKEAQFFGGDEEEHSD